MTDSYDPWANFNPLPQAQKEQTDWMKNYSSGQYNQSNPGQGVRYNTDQGMNNDPWGNRDLNNLAGNGGGGGQPQQANPWDVQQDTRGLQGFGAAPTANQLFGGNQTGGAMSGIPGQPGGQQQANPYGQQQGAFDYNDRAQQDAFVRSLGGNAPAIFGDNGHMTDQDWATRYDAIRQASLGRPLDSFGGPAQQSQRGPGNYYGQGGAHPLTNYRANSLRTVTALRTPLVSSAGTSSPRKVGARGRRRISPEPWLLKIRMWIMSRLIWVAGSGISPLAPGYRVGGNLIVGYYPSPSCHRQLLRPSAIAQLPRATVVGVGVGTPLAPPLRPPGQWYLPRSKILWLIYFGAYRILLSLSTVCNRPSRARLSTRLLAAPRW
jgi:hypothetical protein